MKKIFFNLTFISLFFGSLWGCSEWTTPESEIYFEPRPASYYEDLRAYKKSDHAVAFGWFGNWTGVGASMVGSLMGLPDSVDFVSIWGNSFNLDPARIEDKRKVKELKGTRAILCWIIQDIGDQLTPTTWEGTAEEYWGLDEADPTSIEPAIKKYANALIDSINKYDYDGFDIDYEPNYGHSGSMGGQKDRMLMFVKELGKHLGPMSGTDRLLIVDGEPQSMPAESGPYFSYFIVQAYQSSGDSDLDTRLNGTIDNFEEYLTPEQVARMYIVTENFESYAANGGVQFEDRHGNIYQSLEGMARWTPIINGKPLDRRGGIGTFHMEYDYPGPMEYKYLRKAIQLQNPAVK